MKNKSISRDATRYIHFILDQLLPPILRDSRLLMAGLLRLALGKKAPYFLDFKDRAYDLNDAEFTEIYRRTSGILGRETDLNTPCLTRLLGERFTGTTLFEAGCGTGYLCRRLAEKHPQMLITGMDIQPPVNTIQTRNLNFIAGSVEAIPFPDQSVDTVICTHTLEHVRNLPKAIAELKRIARHKLIIVIPRQRPYRHGFDLHLHFFPYKSSVLFNFLPQVGVAYACDLIAGDWYYVEEYVQV